MSQDIIANEKYANLPISKPSVDIFSFVPLFTLSDTPTNTLTVYVNNMLV